MPHVNNYALLLFLLCVILILLRLSVFLFGNDVVLVQQILRLRQESLQRLDRIHVGRADVGVRGISLGVLDPLVVSDAVAVAHPNLIVKVAELVVLCSSQNGVLQMQGHELRRLRKEHALLVVFGVLGVGLFLILEADHVQLLGK